jgi:hypothetical protein
MDREPGKRLFLYLGIPLLALNFIIGFLGLITGILITIFDFVWVYLILIWGRKENIYNRWLKLSIIVFSIQMSYLIYGVSNPIYWPSELRIGFDRSHLITPNDPNILILREQFDKWLETHPNVTNVHYSIWYEDGYRKYENYAGYWYNLYNISWSNLTDIGKLMVADYYIQNIVMEYEYDMPTYGFNDFKATPNQILQPWIDSGFTNKTKDDCDGSAVVTVSLLKNLGYDAYIGSGKGHWFTVVKLPDYKYEIFLNTWQTINTFAYFNETSITITQSPILTLLDLILWTELPEDFNNTMKILSMGNYAIGFLSSFVVSFALVLFIRSPNSYLSSLNLVPDEEDRKGRKEKLSKYKFRTKRYHPLNWILDRTYIRVGNPFRKRYLAEWINIIFTTIVTFSMIVILGIKPEIFGMYTYIAMIILAFLVIRIVETDFIPIKIISLLRNQAKIQR